MPGLCLGRPDRAVWWWWWWGWGVGGGEATLLKEFHYFHYPYLYKKTYLITKSHENIENLRKYACLFVAHQ